MARTFVEDIKARATGKANEVVGIARQGFLILLIGLLSRSCEISEKTHYMASDAQTSRKLVKAMAKMGHEYTFSGAAHGRGLGLDTTFGR